MRKGIERHIEIIDWESLQQRSILATMEGVVGDRDHSSAQLGLRARSAEIRVGLMPLDTLFDLHDHGRPPRDLPPLNTGSKWASPADLPSLKGVRRLGFDTETYDPDLESLGPGFRRGAYVVGLSLALDNDGPRMYIPVRHQGDGNLDEGTVKRWAQSKLNEFDGELVGANIAYDLDGMAAPQFGVTFPNVKRFHDVLVAEPIIDEWRRSYSLDSVAKTHVGEGKAYLHVHRVMKAYGWKSEKEYKKNIWQLAAHDVGQYAEGDADLPMRILDVQLAKMAEESKEEGVDLLGVYEMESDLIPILVAMRIRGVRVDYARAHEIKRELEAERAKHLTIARRIAGSKVELMAPESFAKALSDRGLEFPLTAKTRKPSITADWLKANAGDELVDAIIGGRRVGSIINTFINGHIEKYSINGRVHPTLKQLKGGSDVDEGKDDGDDTFGAISRFSCANPNIQNIPARDPYLGPLIRSMFIPEDGEDWESTDAEQIEYRYLCNVAVGRGADQARQMYCDDPTTDFHAMCGNMLGADATDSFIRKRVKNVNFCKVYGGGDRKLAVTFGCSEAEAAKFSREYDQKLPFVSETFRKASEWALKRGFIVTILGRKQRFPFWEAKRRKKNDDGSYEYVPPMSYEDAVAAYGEHGVKRAWGHKALNRKLQGSGADHMKAVMVKAWKEGVNRVLGPMLTTVHDEGNHSVPRTAEGQEAAAHFKRCMETCIEGLRVPILAKVKRGENWGSCD